MEPDLAIQHLRPILTCSKLLEEWLLQQIHEHRRLEDLLLHILA